MFNKELKQSQSYTFSNSYRRTKEEKYRFFNMVGNACDSQSGSQCLPGKLVQIFQYTSVHS